MLGRDPALEKCESRVTSTKLNDYGAGVTVNASGKMVAELSGLVTRTSQICGPKVPSFRGVIRRTIVVELTTCVVMMS